MMIIAAYIICVITPNTSFRPKGAEKCAIYEFSKPLSSNSCPRRTAGKKVPAYSYLKRITFINLVSGVYLRDGQFWMALRRVWSVAAQVPALGSSCGRFMERGNINLHYEDVNILGYADMIQTDADKQFLFVYNFISIILRNIFFLKSFDRYF